MLTTCTILQEAITLYIPEYLFKSLLFYLTFSNSYISAFFFFLCLSLPLWRLALLLGEVAVVVEVTEESDEAERVGQDDHVHGVGEVTVGKQVVGGVDCYYEKLELGGRRRTER